MNEYIMILSNKEESIEKIEHGATQQTPALTDYRYVGKNPNNYVYFGCKDNCTEENLYRIIGVLPTQSSENGNYENRVKLIKANNWEGTNVHTQSSNGYKWNTTNVNKWEESSLQKTLNNEYWESLGEYQSFIKNTKWYLGANNILSDSTNQVSWRDDMIAEKDPSPI